MRKCSTCKKQKPLDEFYPSKHHTGGRMYVCKICNSRKCFADHVKKTLKERGVTHLQETIRADTARLEIKHSILMEALKCQTTGARL